MQLSPIPPQPMTATVDPGATFAVLNTAPTPVVTAQPISAARSSGMSSRIFTSAARSSGMSFVIFTMAFSWISICSA